MVRKYSVSLETFKLQQIEHSLKKCSLELNALMAVRGVVR